MTKKSVSCMMLVLAFLCIQHGEVGLCNGASISGCMKSERDVLLNFKEGLKDHANRLSSWTGEDCCNWEGVACDNKTGHVVRLDLRNPHPISPPFPFNRWSLEGKLNSSLLRLKHLNYLDLSMNNFGGISIPKFIASFTNLRYLNLSNAGLGGFIPRQLGNLSRLQYLDLYNNHIDFSNNPEFIIDDAMWISGLSSLKHLNMKNVEFQNVSNWVEALNMLPSIVEISLSYCGIDAISLSLPHVNFTHLSILDLSLNSINSSMIPLWLFNISSLSYIDLSDNSFRGSIPAAVGNLTSLNVLDLSDNQLEGALPKELGSLCKLQTLYLVGNSLSGSIPAAVGNLTSLNVLDLSFNGLEGALPKELGSLCKLQTLSLLQINISKGLPELGDVFCGCIKNSIENLNLVFTQLSGYLPDWLGELRMLTSLLLMGNSLSGSVPELLGSMSALQKLDLSYNDLNGTLPKSLGCLSNLVYLDLEWNLLQGVISEAHFANLSRLEYLELSSNKLVLKVSPDWIPPFQLKSIGMSSCALGPQFPPWLQTQANLSILNISNNGIVGTLPDWFWKNHFALLDISGNGITGRLPDLSGFSISYFDLSSNYFEGHLPNLSSTVMTLILSNNSFSGLIHPGIGETMPNLKLLLLSRNKLSGSIPPSLCKLQYLSALDLSRNFLSGKLPDCWNESSEGNSLGILNLFFEGMGILNFAGNNLSGSIPYTFGSMTSLESLHLSDNSLSGELPSSLRRCTNLTILDLGQNKFTGRIPTWIAESFSQLSILSLRTNMFAGEIPPNLSQLGGLQILDLGNNNLSGTIPQSFGNFTAMKSTRLTIKPVLQFYVDTFGENLEVMIEGSEREYAEFLSLITIMDISDNRLSGEIPREIGNLSGLVSLNLAGNNLIGELPEEVGLLCSLEFIDLSRNELSGAIPSSMSSLTSLSYLNLSYNNLSGEIPSGNQFLTFGNQSYIGNSGLCGFPLSRLCHNETKHSPVDEVEDAGSDIWCLYVSMAPGFVIGFWVVWGPLLIKKKWKDAYFRHVDYIYDRIYVAIAVNLNRLKRKHNVTARG